MFLLIFIVRESQMNQQRFKCILLNKCYLKSKILLKGLFIVYFFLHLFIYFTSHLYCIPRFEDEAAICRIKYQITTAMSTDISVDITTVNKIRIELN